MNFNSILLTIIIVLLVVAGFLFGPKLLDGKKEINTNPSDSIKVDMNVSGAIK